MATHRQVAQAWIAGKAARSPVVKHEYRLDKPDMDATGLRRMETDGLRLWSYRMLIGITLDDGAKVLLDPRKLKVSPSTHKHIRTAWESNVKVVEPVADNWYHRYNRYGFPAEMRERMLVPE